ncbi:MAG: TonB-dependent receptor, partial [Polyangiaceae bacterium]
TWGAVGSFGSARLRVSDTEKLDWNGNDAYVVTGLSASRADDDFTYFDPRTGHDVARVNANHAAVNGLVTVVLPVDWTSSSRGSLKITTVAQARKQGIPGSVDFPTPDARSESTRLLEALELGGTVAGGAWHLRGWGRRESVVTRSSELDLQDPLHTASSVVAAGTGAGWRGRVAERFALATTVDASVERFAPGQTFGGTTRDTGATRALADAGADLDVRVTRAWAASASGRVDLWHDASADPQAVAGTEARPTAHVGSEIAAGPVTFAAHGGAVARAPSFIERYGNHGLVVGNPGLNTETAWVADAGARTSWKHDAFRGRFEVAGFANWADDLIAFVPRGAYRALIATNIGKARILGVEAEAFLFLGGLGLRASYTYLATADETACASDESGSCTRPPLPSRPAHDLFTDLSYRAGPLLVRYGVDVVSGLFVGRLGDVPVPARALQSAGARFDVPHAPGLRLALDVRNLFDLRTGDYDGVSGPITKPIGDSYDYPIPGRSLLFSVRYVSAR